jgi:hypothetical protein
LEYKSKIDEQVRELTELKEKYRDAQQRIATENELNKLRFGIERVTKELNCKLNIGIDNPFHWFIEFNQIMKKGGFNVIIGNPPYVEYSEVRNNYRVKGFTTEKSGNLYAYIIERSHRVGSSDSYASFIVPVSIICTDRMMYTQSYLLKQYNNLWISSYAERPSKLFEGAERNVSILIYNNRSNQDGVKIYATEYLKWYSSERKNLFRNLRYNEISGLNKKAVIPKLGSRIENSIWKKIESCNSMVECYLSPSRNEFKLVYRNSGGRYWKIVTDFTPHFTIDGKRKISSRETYLYAKSKLYRDCLITILNSTTYYWWYIQNSDTRTNNPRI